MSSKNLLERKFLKSLHKQWVLRFSTIHPDGDHYDGVVTAIRPDFIIVCEETNWEFDGIQIFAKRAITDIRDGKYEACANRIVRGNDALSQVVMPGWLEACQTLNDVLQAVQQQEIWPAVETLSDNDQKDFFYLGPITKFGEHSFWIRSYDADGKWERQYEIDYSEVFRIEFGSRYCNHFNDYMRSQSANRSTTGKTKPRGKRKRIGK